MCCASLLSLCVWQHDISLPCASLTTPHHTTPGVTRDSIIELCRSDADLQSRLQGFSSSPLEVTERTVSMPELVQAEKEGLVSE